MEAREEHGCQFMENERRAWVDLEARWALEEAAHQEVVLQSML
jgi:hypothetical protein